MRLINPEIRIETTNACNANCVYCARSKMTRPITNMGYGHFKDLVEQAVELGAELISPFGFGEPLLDIELMDKIFLCFSNGLDTFITTNGSLLNRKLGHKLLQSNINHVRFSFHELFPKEYNGVHYGLKHHITMKNICDFIDIRDKAKSKCKISISAIPGNDDDINSIIRFWEPLVDYLEIWRPHNWANKRRFRKADRKKKTCGRPFNGPVQIQSDGTVIPCCFITNSEIILGDTYKNSIEDILNGDAYNELRRKHESGDLSGLICETCDQLNIENDNPLIYSNRDKERLINVTSSMKFKMEDK
jgi:radical SAM protein with 4Fe4S-binding SPASM domain